MSGQTPENPETPGTGFSQYESTKRGREFTMGFFKIPVKLYFLTFTLLFSMVGLVYYTVKTLDTNQKYDAKLIYLAGKQRMLTQQLSKSLMALLLGEQKKIEEINSIKMEFRTVLQALMQGDEELGVSAVQTGDILDRFNKIQEQWVPFVMNVEIILHAWPEVSNNIDAIMKSHSQLFEEAQEVVILLSKKSDLQTVASAGRLREIIQRLTKTVLGFTRYNDKRFLDESMKHIKLQDKIIQGLLEGDSSLNLNKIEDAFLRKKIYKLKTNWELFREKLDHVFKTLPTVHNASEYISENNLNLLQAMNSAVKEMASLSQKRVVNMINNQYKALIILFAFGFILSTIIIRQITTPLGEVTLKLGYIAKGNFRQEKMTIKTRDEVGFLQKTFNTLVDNMTWAIRQLDGISSGEIQKDIQLRRGDFEKALRKFIMSTMDKNK
jgi:methyl-accepting chemotaxis protein